MCSWNQPVLRNNVQFLAQGNNGGLRWGSNPRPPHITSQTCNPLRHAAPLCACIKLVIYYCQTFAIVVKHIAMIHPDGCWQNLFTKRSIDWFDKKYFPLRTLTSLQFMKTCMTVNSHTLGDGCVDENNSLWTFTVINIKYRMLHCYICKRRFY